MPRLSIALLALLAMAPAEALPPPPPRREPEPPNNDPTTPDAKQYTIGVDHGARSFEELEAVLVNHDAPPLRAYQFEGEPGTYFSEGEPFWTVIPRRSPDQVARRKARRQKRRRLIRKRGWA